MSTQNHKPATTFDILSGAPANNPQIQESNNPSSPTNPPIHKSNYPFTAAARSRCGKVARLPKEIRDQLNEMLLDGIPHAQIIQKLRQNFGPGSAGIGPQSNVVPLAPTDATSSPGTTATSESDSVNHETRNTEHAPSPSSSIPQFQQSNNPLPSTPVTDHQSLLAALTPHHITTWKKFGGYRDWLKDQQRLEECKLRHELTLNLARSAEGLASYQAAPKVAVAQICQTIIDLGPEGLKDAMKDSPLNCFRLLNALARLINSGLKCESHLQKSAATIENGTRRLPATRERWEKLERKLNLM